MCAPGASGPGRGSGAKTNALARLLARSADSAATSCACAGSSGYLARPRCTPATSQGPTCRRRRAAWTDWDTSGQVQHFGDCGTNAHGSVFFQINYPTGVLGHGTGVGVELRVPATGPRSAISIARVTDWSSTALAAQHPNEARAEGINLAPAISSAPGGSADAFDGTGTSGAGHDSGPLAAGTKTWRLGVQCAAMGAQLGQCTLPSPFLRVRGIRTTL